MPIRDDAELDALLIAAAEAPPDTRIQYRDPIAAFGDKAVERLSMREWLGDPRYAAFAIRTIGRAGALGAMTAPAALRNALASPSDELAERDIREQLQQLGVPSRHKRSPTQARSGSPATKTMSSMSVDDLQVGQTYRRTELHDGGLGGNPQTGISYPANGTYALLFSDPSKASAWGYRDMPVGEDEYRFYGHWYGPGDMSMDRGNREVCDRSPELFLFTASQGGFVYRGQFQCSGWDWEPTTRDGREDRAIVFRLRRMR